MMQNDDMTLVRDYAATQSEPAFAELVSRHIHLVHAAALRQVGDPHLAEEITQAVFIILARKAGALSPQTVLSGWLYRTALFVGNDMLKTRHRRQRREQEAQMDPIIDPQASEQAWEELSPLLEEAMARLGETDRNAVVLRFFENKSLAEVGAALGVEERAAQKRVTRALAKLHQFFGRRGVTFTAAIIGSAIATHSVHAAPPALAQAVTVMALSKGATASISTLTLIKGALKIMAWTKAKTSIVVGVSLLLVAGTTTIAVKHISQTRAKTALAAMAGNWEGTLTAGPAQLRLVLKIFATNGSYRAVLDSVDQGVKDIPIVKLSAQSQVLHVTLPALDADYQATLNADGTELAGVWKQLGRPFPLQLKRTTEPARVAEPLAADVYAPRPDSDLQGAWEGALKVGNVALRLNLRIAESAPGVFHAQLDSVDQGVRNISVSSLTYHKPALRFELTALNGVFEGNLGGQGGNQLTGTWTQMGKSLPLTFQRGAATATAAAEKDFGQGTSYQAQGHWQGALEINKTALHLVFHIATLPDGSYTATMDSPDQGATGIPATAAQFTYPNVRLEWQAIGGVFAGKLENGRLTGTWQQGKAVLPLKLERTPAK